MKMGTAALTPDNERLISPDDALPSRGLLSFYDRLREQIVATVERRGGRLSAGTVEALLLVPDVFILLVRLMLDREVPQSKRLLVGGALAYFIVPVDFLPEALLGPTALVDDLILATAVLAQAFGRELEPYAERYWSGSERLRTVIADVLDAAHHLVGHDVYERLRRYLAKQGVDLDAAPG